MFQASISYFYKENNITENDCHHLIVYVGMEVFSYIIVNTENEILVFEKYNLPLNDTDVMNQFFTEKNWLKSTFSSTKIAFGTNHTSTMPNKFYETNKISDWLDMQYGDINAYQSFANENIQHQLQTLYRVEKKLFETIQHHFPFAKKIHIQSAVIQKEVQETNSGVELFFLEDAYVLHIFSNKKLIFIKTFAFSNNEELVYNLIAACNLHHININETTVHLSGWLSKASALYKEMYKFIPYVTFDETQTKLKLEIENLENHFFYPFEWIQQIN